MSSKLTKYNPFSLAQEIQNELNRFFNDSTDLPMMTSSTWSPALDIQETPAEFVIKCDLPDVKPEDIDIHVENGNLLSINGSRNLESRHSEKGYTRMERFSGSFRRSMLLPCQVDSNNIQAKVSKGVLHVNIPKIEKSSPKRVEVKGE